MGETSTKTVGDAKKVEEVLAARGSYEAKALRLLDLAAAWGADDLASQTALAGAYTLATLELARVNQDAARKIVEAIGRR